jgi:hypothetical protein
MTANQQFWIELLKEGKGYIPMVLALIAGWHAPQPRWMKKKPESKEEG